MAKILIVDSSALMRQRLAELVREVPGVSVVGVADRAELAVALAEQMQPDLVLLDLQLPDGRALGALARLRAGPRSPIILGLTGGVTPQHLEMAARLGVTHVLDELHDFERILEVAGNLVDRRLVA